MNKIYCQQCKSLIDEKEINVKSKIYHCIKCDGFYNITTEQVANSLKKSLKVRVPKPPNVSLTRNEQSLSVLVSPSKKEKLKSIPLVIVLLFMLICFMGVFSSGGQGMVVIVPLLFIGIILHLLLSSFFQKSEVKINESNITYRVKNYYSFGFKLKMSQSTSTIEQLFVKQRKISSGDNNETIVFDLILITKESKQITVIANSKSPETLFYLEQLIEEELEIEDSIHPSETPNIGRMIPSISDVIKVIRQK